MEIDLTVIICFVIGGILGIILIIPYYNVLSLCLLWLSSINNNEITSIYIYVIYTCIGYSLLSSYKLLLFNKYKESQQLNNNNIKSSIIDNYKHISTYIICIMICIPICIFIKQQRLYMLFLTLTIIYTIVKVIIMIIENKNKGALISGLLITCIISIFIIKSNDTNNTGILFSLISLPFISNNKTAVTSISYPNYIHIYNDNPAFINHKEYNIFDIKNYIYGETNNTVYFNVLIIMQSLINGGERDVIGTVLNINPQFNVDIVPIYQLPIIITFIALIIIYSSFFHKIILCLHITLKLDKLNKMLQYAGLLIITMFNYTYISPTSLYITIGLFISICITHILFKHTNTSISQIMLPVLLLSAFTLA